MSNPVPFDPYLVHHLARELDEALRGRACDSVPIFDSDRSVVLPLDRGEALSLELHPARGWIRLIPWSDDSEPREAVCLGVETLPDERVLSLRLRGGNRFTAAEQLLVVELHTNQWNALLVSADDSRILSALRARRAGDRVLRPGHPYAPPPPRPRFGGGPTERSQALARWRETLAGVPEGELATAILRTFAYTGGVSAKALARLCGEGDAGMAEAFEHWWRIRSLGGAEPVLLETPAGRPIPYPLPLPRLPARPVASLLEAMEEAAAADAQPSPEVAAPDPLLPRVERRRAAAERKLQSLGAELARAGEGERLRHRADLLLSQLHTLKKGTTRATLEDWEGGTVEVELDPALTPAENASAWYEDARRRTRAAEQLPGMIEEASAEVARWAEAYQQAESGVAPAWVEAELERGRSAERGATGEEQPTMPYRSYRTSGGLEVRVGRSAKDNDRLTFHFSAPNDVWLHARSVPGSHVILRWPDAEGAPPARDLEEAAGLAALYSKARSSALVPVDWTRRKHVRKPRGAPPGAVIPQRVKTLFVEPDAALDERMRDR